jgi:hypothetical protein
MPSTAVLNFPVLTQVSTLTSPGSKQSETDLPGNQNDTRQTHLNIRKRGGGAIRGAAELRARRCEDDEYDGGRRWRWIHCGVTWRGAADAHCIHHIRNLVSCYMVGTICKQFALDAVSSAAYWLRHATCNITPLADPRSPAAEYCAENCTLYCLCADLTGALPD